MTNKNEDPEWMRYVAPPRSSVPRWIAAAFIVSVALTIVYRCTPSFVSPPHTKGVSAVSSSEYRSLSAPFAALNFADLPSEPDKKAALKGLRGVDTNKNGVRDEVELVLWQRFGLKISETSVPNIDKKTLVIKPKSVLTPREILIRQARSKQRFMEKGKNAKLSDRLPADCLIVELARASLFANGIDPDRASTAQLADSEMEIMITSFEIIRAIEVFTANTIARRKAMEDAEVSISRDPNSFVSGGLTNEELQIRCAL